MVIKMSDPVIRFLKTHPDAVLPAAQTAGSAGADLCAVMPDGVSAQIMRPGARLLIDTGLKVAVPDGFELQIRPRSGLALKHGVTVLNAPGTIDSDYRGPLKVILVNLGEENFTIRTGDRVAQAVLAPVTPFRGEIVETLDETARGEGGFGSTGVSGPETGPA
jgi:dUTP pyrophosphatase